MTDAYRDTLIGLKTLKGRLETQLEELKIAIRVLEDRVPITKEADDND